MRPIGLFQRDFGVMRRAIGFGRHLCSVEVLVLNVSTPKARKAVSCRCNTLTRGTPHQTTSNRSKSLQTTSNHFKRACLQEGRVNLAGRAKRCHLLVRVLQARDGAQQVAARINIDNFWRNFGYFSAFAAPSGAAFWSVSARLVMELSRSLQGVADTWYRWVRDAIISYQNAPSAAIVICREC